MEEKYSARGAIVLKEAKNLAILHNNPQITDIHVHIALIQQDKSPIDTLFKEFGIDKTQYLNRLDNALSHLDSNPGISNLYYSRDYQRLLLNAKEIARAMYHTSIGTNHLFLALFKLEKTTSVYLLDKAGLDYKSCYNYILELTTEYNLNEKYPQGISEVLKQYGRDLTQEVRDGKIDPVIGMDDEINRVIQILSRRIKNNPIIVGEPGVGKTSVVEGLAQRIVNHDVPDILKHRMIFSLKISDVIAGSKLRGEFEEKLQEILDIVAKSNRRIIIFIDEIHTVIGSGSSSNGMDTSNILKPMLSRGEINVIGATTNAEYLKYIRKDGALERRFQKVTVREPDVETTISILRGIKNKYEVYHGLRIKDEALIASAQLSKRYIGNRYLPDKAIDVMDEACSMVRTEIDAMPLELDELKRKILQLQMEKILLKEEYELMTGDSTAVADRLNKVTDSISELSSKFGSEKKIWLSEKQAIKELQVIRREIEEIERKKDQAQRNDAFEEIVNYTQVQLPQLREKLNTLLEKSYHYNIIEEVNKNHVNEIISKTTGIPITELDQDEKDKLLNLENALNEYIIGQKEPIKLISNSILRSKAGMKAVNKPIASYLFIGPTGVGKTYLAKVLTNLMYQSYQNLVRLDMSEYMEKNSVTKLIGSPPGYIGYDEGGQLTEKISNNPYSVVLFDEVEKANPQVFNLLLQILDEGNLTDSKGRVVDFSNTVIILTSNIGVEERRRNKKSIRESVSDYFRPEFINRLDGVVEFNYLDKKAISKIIDIYITEIEENLSECNIQIDVSEKAKKNIIEMSNYQEYGSREVVRIIKNEIETLIAIDVLKGKIVSNTQITIEINAQNDFYLSY